MPKRNYGTYSAAQRRAAAISAKMRSKFPYSKYGVAHLERGGPWLNHLGESFKSANAEQRQNRRDVGYYGRGMYTGGGMYTGPGTYSGRGSFWSSITRGVKDVGHLLGPQITGALSNKIASSISGSGSYATASDAVHHNSLVTGGHSNRGSAAYGGDDELGSLCLSNREYITDVYAPPLIPGSSNITPFQNSSLPINPALVLSFPFLSQLAANYEEYEFVQLIYTFRSTTTDIGSSGSGQCGTVIMCTNYNAAQKPFADKQQMVEYTGAHSCKTTEHMVHGVECDRNKTAISTQLYTRASPVVNGEDLKTYDHGLFQIAVNNAPNAYANQAIGELWVDYKIILRKPKLFVNRGFNIDREVYYSPSTIGSSATGVPQAIGTTPFLNVKFAEQANNIGILPVLNQDTNSWTTNVATQPSTGYSADTVTVTSGTFPAAGTAGQRIAFIFPAAFTGNIKLQITLDTGLNLVAGAAQVAPEILFGGNIIPIVDICRITDPDVWFQFTNAVAIGSTGVIMLHAHFFVNAATGGKNNIVYLNQASGGTQTIMSRIEFSEYNARGLNAISQRAIIDNYTNGMVVSNF